MNKNETILKALKGQPTKRGFVSHEFHHPISDHGRARAN